MTIPLGCLKTGDIIFKPALPAWKQDAVEKLGFGNLNKVNVLLHTDLRTTLASVPARVSVCQCITPDAAYLGLLECAGTAHYDARLCYLQQAVTKHGLLFSVVPKL